MVTSAVTKLLSWDFYAVVDYFYGVKLLTSPIVQ